MDSTRYDIICVASGLFGYESTPSEHSLQNFLAFMDPTNAEYYLFKEGADRIRKGMTTAIAWIVLQAVYQGEDHGRLRDDGLR